jgi:ceramide glucosyltransferase
MIEWILCGLMLAWIISLAILVWAARRAMADIPVPSSNAPGRRVAVIVPVAGGDKPIEPSIRSLLSQTHPSIELVFALRDLSDPASVAVQAEIRGREAAKIVLAGPAIECGQKNQNMLAGIAAVSGGVEVFVFADAGHGFPAGWLERLVAPIAHGEAEVTSGYHTVRPENGGFLPWVYAVCVETMRVFQNAPGLRQPWGGAMAISRAAFERLKVADTWRTSVVDDVSLARVLKAHGLKVRTVPLVRRDTLVTRLNLRDLFEWMVRQLQYVRFILPGTWVVVGGWSLVQVVAFSSAAVLVVGSIVGLTPALSAAASALYLLLLAIILLQIRLFHPLPCRPSRWLAAGATFLIVFGVALGTAGLRRRIQWRGITYHVGRGGRVLAIHRSSLLERAAK